MLQPDFMAEFVSRQVPVIGQEGCEKLASSTVAIAGLGGVGGLAIELIVRSGVSNIRILDHDTFDVSNLNRQVLATSKSIDLPKVEGTISRLTDINPNLKIQMSIQEKATVDNVHKLLDGVDVALLCSDSPGSQMLFDHVAQKFNLLVIGGAASGMKARMWVIDHSNPENWMTRLKKKFIKNEPVALTDEMIREIDKPFFNKKGITPSISFTPNTTACVIASYAVNYLVGNKVPVDRVVVDLEKMKIHTRKIGSPSYYLEKLGSVIRG
jgi:molybdopterin/thiamine biosynthesis adenylyltransferase